MKRALLLALLTTGFGLNVLAEPVSGLVDFGKFTPPAKGGEFVEVLIKTNLISIAAKLVEKEQPDVAKMIRSVELIRVNVIGLNDENRADLSKRVERIRSELDAKGWDRNVKVQGKKGENVAVFTRTRGDEALAGLVITVMDKEHLVLANIVGDIKPSEVASLGESLHIKPLAQIADAIKQ